MRFESLFLRAYGPFTDFHLDLDKSVGFHLFYGPNEAGKSSMLRGIRSMLYGVETRTTDDFLHDKQELRVGARLLHSDGRCLEFLRRKGRKNTVLNLDGTTLDEAALNPYLGGVDEALFQRLYGLDHRTLLEGGRALLEGEGDMGQSLFAAGLGPELRHLAKDLSEEADTVWRERGQKYPLNQALSNFKDARKEVTRRSLSPKQWTDLEKQISTIEEELEKFQESLQQAKREQNRLERFQKALPLVARRRQLRESLAELAGTPELRTDFGERRRELEHDLRETEFQLKRVGEKIEATDRSLCELPDCSQLLHHTDQIEEFYRRVDGYTQSDQKVRQRNNELSSVTGEADSLARDLAPGKERGEVTLPSAGMRRLAGQIVGRYQTARTELDGCERRRAQKRADRERLEGELQELGEEQSLDSLEQLDRELARESKLDQEITEGRRAVGEAREQLSLALAQLPYHQGDVDSLRSLRVPLLDVVERYQGRFLELQQEEKALARELGALVEECGSVVEEQKSLKGLEGLPTRDQLVGERARRDEQMKSLSLKWESGGDFAQSQWSLLEETVHGTDKMADLLFSEAETVTEIAGLERRRSTLEEKKRVKEQALQKVREQHKEQLTEWKGQLSSLPVTDLRPEEMKVWLQKREQVLEKAATVESLQSGLTVQEERREALLGKLREVVSQVPSTLGEASQSLQGILEPQRKKAERRRALALEKSNVERELGELEVHWEQLSEKLTEIRSQWNEILNALDLETLTEPADLSPLLEKYERLGSLLAREGQLDTDLGKLQRERELYETRVRELATVLLDSSDEQQTEVLVRLMYERLQTARKSEESRRHLGKQAEVLDDERTQLLDKAALCRRELDGLVAEAGADSASELPEIEERARRKASLGEQLERVEESLQELSAGVDLDTFCSEVGELDADLLPELQQECAEKVEQLEGKRLDLREELGECRKQREHLTEGAGSATEAATDLEEALADIQREVERYALLTLSHHLLSAQIEEYRRSHQGPILERAQHSFELLTNGYYPSLETGYDEKSDQPILLACDRAGRRVGVEGLSDGTRDQLFLALRLATIEQQLVHHEAVPFIADDLLVHFDSDRALAALKLLAEFSGKTQVLFFTHLERDRELAAQLPKGTVEIHELGRALG